MNVRFCKRVKWFVWFLACPKMIYLWELTDLTLTLEWVLICFKWPSVQLSCSQLIYNFIEVISFLMDWWWTVKAIEDQILDRASINLTNRRTELNDLQRLNLEPLKLKCAVCNPFWKISSSVLFAIWYDLQCRWSTKMHNKETRFLFFTSNPFIELIVPITGKWLNG